VLQELASLGRDFPGYSRSDRTVRRQRLRCRGVVRAAYRAPGEGDRELAGVAPLRRARRNERGAPAASRLAGLDRSRAALPILRSQGVSRYRHGGRTRGARAIVRRDDARRADHPPSSE